MQKVSALITTFNEAENILSAINSVRWADEILVVDSFSGDNTLELAKQSGAKTLQRIYTGPGEQKNWAIPQAKNEWVLLMDADERATPALMAEINELLSKPFLPYDAFWIGFQHYFMNKAVRYSGWQNDKTIRLIRRSVCRYNANRVHEEIITDNIRVGTLANRFEHYTYKDLDHFVDKMQRYASWSAEDYEISTNRITAYHLAVKPFIRFCKHYFWKGGFLDGKVGFIISSLMAWGVMMRYVKIIEKRDAQIQERV